MIAPRSTTFLLLLAAALSASAAGGQFTDKDIPLSTNSDEAKRVFRGGIENLENQQTRRAHVDFRSAARADENFALAHLFVAYDNGDPAEEKTELDKAQALASNATKPEQLMVQWLAGWREGQMVPAIAAMNDLVALYPQDKFLLFLAGRWMVQQQNYDAAQHLLERAVALDPNYPAAQNELAYAYAGTYDFNRAFPALDKYVALQPGEPNTEDSYGEISRKAGRFEQALTHYRKALEYDSAFFWSQAGIADTYMLMGKEEQARVEYAKAIAMAPTVGDRLNEEIQLALTYMYADQHHAADAAFTKIAEEAHSLHVGYQEAMAYRIMSQYDPDASGFLQHSRDAENALNGKTDISGNDRDQETALMLKVRAVRAAEFGNVNVSNEALQKLAAMAASSSDTMIQEANEGAMGGALWAQKKYAEAVPHLEEDQTNQLSAARLVL